MLHISNYLAPSQPPEMLTLVDITSHTVTVTWQPPPLDSHNGVIRGYTVRIILDSNNDLSLFNVTGSIITIPDLHPYSSYDVAVAAFTTDRGPFSNVLSLTSSEAGIALI